MSGWGGVRLDVSSYEKNACAADQLGPEPDTVFLGLFGEVGSLMSALKKKRRDTDGYVGYHDAVLEEIGDVLWYTSAVARRAGIPLKEVVALAAGKARDCPLVALGDLAPGASHGPDEADLQRALLNLAAEAGDVAKRFAAGIYEHNTATLERDLVKLLRPLGQAAMATEVSVDEAGRRNNAKTESRWPIEKIFPPLFDAQCHPDEQLPRLIRMQVFERAVHGKVFAYQKCDGLLVGDRLTDNHDPEDDYRFHDVLHLAHAAVLGWSPVTRALFKVKRKSDSKTDENEDGARAILIEEGLTTWIFEIAKQYDFFGNTRELGLDLLKSVKQFVKGYEPQHLPMWLWNRAILQGYAVFRQFREQRHGIAVADMTAREIRFEPLGTAD